MGVPTSCLEQNGETLKKKEQGHNEARDTRPQALSSPKAPPL